MADWESDLENFFVEQRKKGEAETEKRNKEQSEAEVYITEEVLPAFKALQTELERHGREVSIRNGRESASIDVSFQGNLELHFTVQTNGTRVYPVTRFREKTNGQMYKSEGLFLGDSSKSNIARVKKDDIIRHFLEDYKRTVSY